MSVTVILNGVSYDLPETGEVGWGDVVTNYLQAVSTGVLSKAGGSFILTNDANFGGNYGLLSKYFKTRTSNPAATGVVRLANAETIGWRNAANSSDLLLTVNASGQLTYNGVMVSTGSALTAADVANVPSGNLSATNVQAALDELQSELDALPAATKTFTNKTMSGASNTFSAIPTAALASTATANTASTLVLRDASGNFSAGTVTLNSLNVPAGTVTADSVTVSSDLLASNAELNSLDVTTNAGVGGQLSANTLVSNSLTANAGQMLELRGRTADGAAAVGVTIGPDIDYAVSGAKAIRFMKGSWEMGYFDRDSVLHLAGNLLCANIAAGGIFGSSSAFPVTMTGTMSNSSTAIGVKLDAANALSTSGANIAVFTNASTEKLAVTKDGNLDWLNGTAFINYSTVSSNFSMNKSLDITNAATGTLYTDYIEAGYDVNVYGALYAQNGINTDAASSISGGTLAIDTINSNSNPGILFQSNTTGGSVGTDFTFTSTSVRTAGNLLEVQNNGSEVFRVEPSGNGYLNSLKIVTETPAFLALIAPKTRVMSLAMEDWRAGGSAPGHATYGSAPRKSGWRYTTAGAGNQEMEMFLDVPDDIDVNYDAYIDIAVLLENAETVGDTCDWQVEYVSTAAPGSLAGTATTATRTMSIQSGATAAGTMYSVAILLDPLDATNPLNTPDCHVAFGLKRSTAGTISNVIVLGACFKYTSKI